MTQKKIVSILNFSIQTTAQIALTVKVLSLLSLRVLQIVTNTLFAYSPFFAIPIIIVAVVTYIKPNKPKNLFSYFNFATNKLQSSTLQGLTTKERVRNFILRTLLRVAIVGAMFFFIPQKAFLLVQHLAFMSHINTLIIVLLGLMSSPQLSQNFVPRQPAHAP